MCLAFKDTLLGKTHKTLDDARTRMWSSLGMNAIRDGVGERLGVASKYTNADSTKKSKPAQPSTLAIPTGAAGSGSSTTTKASGLQIPTS